MPELSSKIYDCEDGLRFKMPYEIDSAFMSINDWKNQVMAWYDKTSSDIPKEIDKENFEAILKSLHGKNATDENELKSYYQEVQISYQKEVFDGFRHCNGTNERVYELLDKAGYYKLTVYDFIKTISDKRGAHVDIEITPLVMIFNNQKLAPIDCFAVQMIQQAKNMIPELQQYEINRKTNFV